MPLNSGPSGTPRASGVSIELAAYDPRWPATFETLATPIRDALGDVAIMLEHVGSTSVPGLAAKPILDMLLVVADSRREGCYTPALTSLGFLLHLREPAWHEHRLFKLRAPAVNLHVFSTGCVEIARMLTFRDHLREYPDARESYEAVKRELATREWRRVQDYADAKSEIVERILIQARGNRADDG